MLVPEIDVQPPGTDERTSTPGAATSGFMRSDIGDGPTDEKSAWTRPPSSPSSTAPTVIARAEFPGEPTDPAPTSL